MLPMALYCLCSELVCLKGCRLWCPKEELYWVLNKHFKRLPKRPLAIIVKVRGPRESHREREMGGGGRLAVGAIYSVNS